MKTTSRSNQDIIKGAESQLQKIRTEMDEVTDKLKKTSIWEPQHKILSARLTELQLDFSRIRTKAVEDLNRPANLRSVTKKNI